MSLANVDIDPKQFKAAIIIFFTVMVLFLGAVFISGSTHGQRCTKAGYEGSQFDDCVQRLSKFGVLHVKDLPSWTKE